MVATVLLVDDHELIRQGLRRAFERADDFTVVGEAASVAEAVAAAKQHQPDVVVVDVRLPDGNGLDVARMLRDQNEDIGIVVLTMYAGDEQLFGALEAGAHGILYPRCDNADEAREVGLPVRLHLADSEMHRKRGAVLAHAGNDAADADDAAFTRLQVAGEVAVMAATIRLRHQLADILADRFGCGVAELPLGGAREKLHDAMRVDYDHGIGDCIQDRTEVPLACP